MITNKKKTKLLVIHKLRLFKSKMLQRTQSQKQVVNTILVQDNERLKKNLTINL